MRENISGMSSYLFPSFYLFFGSCAMRLIIAEDGNGAAQWVAAHVKRCILEFAPTAERPFVLGLPTGSSPVATYKVVIHHFPPISLCSNYPSPPPQAAG